jgi:uncharacterized membrane protein (UPF0136 family)
MAGQGWPVARLGRWHLSKMGVIESSPLGPRQSLKSMHPFCLTIPYGGAIALGGLVGFLKRGSVASLGAGCGSGGMILLLAHASLQKYRRGEAAHFETAASLLIALLLSAAMGSRYRSSGKFMPAGMVAALSLAMSAFLAFRCARPAAPKLSKKS